jgi:hypothetical protein
MFFAGGFAAKGPLIGWLVIWAELLAVVACRSGVPPITSGQALLAGFGQIIGLSLFSLVFAYGLAIIPALLTGFVCFPVSRIPMPVWSWVIACAAVGGTVCGLVWLVFSPHFGLALLVTGVLPGAVAAAVCGWQGRGRRLSL